MGREIELLRDHLLNGIVCCDVNPTSENAFDEVDRLCKQLYNGTTGGWRTLREGDNLFGRTWDEVKPIPCKERQNRWHYVVIT